MLSKWSAFQTIFAFALWVPGLISNLFIVSSILVQMRLEGSLQTVNILMGFNSLNNLALVFVTFSLILGLHLVCLNHVVILGLMFIWEISSMMQMWGITLICVFYCLKIVPWRGRSALWLKGNFSSVTAVLLMVGLAFALVVSSIDLQRERPKNETHQWVNQTCHSYIKLPDRLVPLKMTISALLHISVFSLMTFSCAALVAHLYSHMRRMRGNQPDVSGSKQQGVACVTLMIFLLAVEFGSSTIAKQWLVIQTDDQISDNLISDTSIVSLALCSLIPVTLITGTSSLRESATSCCFKA